VLKYYQYDIATILGEQKLPGVAFSFQRKALKAESCIQQLIHGFGGKHNERNYKRDQS
jgi:hypothetical protein